jgi:hypothetical protein
METVKVDIQKLQLLNDRIAQVIDALNQVRMSAHGIQHTGAPLSPWGYGAGFGAYGNQPYGVVPQFTPYASPFVGTAYDPRFGGSPFTGTPQYGIQHATALPWLTNPFTNPFVTGLQSPVASALGAFTMPYVGNGISHTTFDPTWQQRAWQTSFPFAGTQMTTTPTT